MNDLKSLSLLFFIIILPGISVAQELGISGSSQFRRQLDSFFWNYDAGFEQQWGDYSVYFQNNFNSRFSLFDGEVRNIQDENIALLNFSGLMNQQLGFAGEARSYRFSNTNVKQDFAMAGVMYQPVEYLRLTGLGGFMQDQRSSITDNGAMVGIRGETQPLQLGDFLVQSQLYTDYANISPRTYQTYRLLTDTQFEIENFTMDGSLQLTRNVRDSYQASSFFNREVSDFTESIRTDTTGLRMTAYFPIFDNLQSRLDVNMLTNVRVVTNNPLFPEIDEPLFDTRILRQSFNVRFQTTVPYRSSSFTAGFSYSVSAREARLINTDNLSDDQVRRRTDILQNSNFDQTRFELFTNNQIELSESNTTRLSGNVSIMNYDTPGLNKDDRDELFIQLRLWNEHRFSEFFSTRVTLAGEATHSVYLFAERSIENNWRRSVRLIPEFEWNPVPWLNIRQQLLVRANYTVEDYEIPGRQKNDQVSREFAINTQVSARLNQEWSIEVSGYRSELRIGRLLWSEFKEIPTDTLITYDFRGMLTHRAGALLTSVGMRTHIKRDYMPRLTVIADDVTSDGTSLQRTRVAPGIQTTIQWGPMIQMRLPLYSRNELIVNGWYQMQGIRQKLYTEYPEEFRGIFVSAERKVRRKVYPNLEIMARFRL